MPNKFPGDEMIENTGKRKWRKSIATSAINKQAGGKKFERFMLYGNLFITRLQAKNFHPVQRG